MTIRIDMAARVTGVNLSRILLVACFTLLAGCGPGGQAGSRDTRQAEGDAPPVGPPKSITIIMNRDPTGFGPHQEADSNLTPIFLATLTRYKVWDQKYEPLLASEAPSLERGSWKAFPDGRMETTWKIRPDVKWHDGTAFSAKDLVFGWQVVMDPQFTALQATIPSMMESVTAPDDQTLLITWKQLYIYANLCVKSCLVPLPRHILEAKYRQDPSTLAGHPYFTTEFVGQGPYRVTRFDPGQGIDFEAFPDYFLGRPKIDKVFYRVVSDSNNALARVLANDVDISLRSNLGFTQSLVAKEQWEANGQGSVSYVSTGWSRINLSPTNPLFAWENPNTGKVRQALLQGIDRKEIVNTLFNGIPGVPDTMVRPSDPIFARVDPSVKKYPFDPNAARRLLSEAGWRPGPDGILANDRGERFSIEAQMEAGDAQGEGVQAAVLSYWRALGVESKVNNLNRRALQSIENRGRWQGARWTGGSLEPNDPLNSDWHTRNIPTEANGWDGDAVTHWSGGNAILERWERELDITKREDLRTQLALRWADDLPSLPLTFTQEISTIRKGLVNVAPRLGSGGANAITWNIEAWDVQRS